MPKMPKHGFEPNCGPTGPAGVTHHRPVSASDDVKLRALYTQLSEELHEEFSKAVLKLKIDGGQILDE